MSARRVVRLETGWKFHLGDIPAPLPNTHLAAYLANKAGRAVGAAKPSFDDSDWFLVDLPHDWSVHGPVDPANHVDGGFLPRGTAWYRLHFRLDDSDRGSHLALQFDGVATHCAVYVNGHLLHRNFCGYTPFTLDITDIANFGDRLNVVAVRVDGTYPEGWWYEGAGIYRHVRLIQANRIHIAPHGVFVCPRKLADDDWNTYVQTTVENTSDEEADCEITWEILDPSGQSVGRAVHAAKITARSIAEIEGNILVTRPSLWSLKNPYLYQLTTQICCAGQTIDDSSTPFGYRTICFDADHGFFLNDQPVKLKGTCNHQDHACVGVAVPDSIHRFRIRRLREMGSNAYRCAHNPPAPELLDACDELGMLVMDENRNFGSSPQHLDQLQSMVRRDRNHPSIILWSLCNEETEQGTPTGARIARTLSQAVKRLDASRPITAAVSGGILNDDCVADVIQIMGINYQLPVNDAYHAKHPRTPIVAAETHCALTTRGVYQTDAERRVFASYDNDRAFWGTTARQAWKAVSARPFIAGLFAWTGFDYRGEPSPHHWPCVSSHWGILDTCGFEKDSFYLHKAWFTQEPFVHLLPHWNWPAADGRNIRVVACTNCQAVELFQDGRSLGRKLVDPIEMVDWLVAYQPGALKAIAYRGDEPVAEKMVETTGVAVAVGLEVHPSMAITRLPADDQFAVPITAFAMDQAGRRVPTAHDFVSFSISGPARILGVGNGDPNCHEPDKANARSLFNGLAQLIIQTTAEAGRILVTAQAPALHPARLELHSQPAAARPSLPSAPVRYLLSDWRMSPITPQPPDPNQVIADQDMNTWERIDPAQGPQKAWDQSPGFAVYRTVITPPRVMCAAGGRIIFRQLLGRAEIYLNGAAMAAQNEIPFPPGSDKLIVSILIHGESAPAGIAGPVELLGA